MTEPTPQYLFCSICLGVQTELEAAGKDVELAVTITRGEAVCLEHRNKVDGTSGAILGARRYLERQSNGGQPAYRGNRR